MRTSRLSWGKGESCRCLHLLIHWGDLEGRWYRAVQVRITTLKVKLKAEDGALSQAIAASRKSDTCFLILIPRKENMEQWLNQPEHPKWCHQPKVSREQMMSAYSPNHCLLPQMSKDYANQGMNLSSDFKELFVSFSCFPTGWDIIHYHSVCHFWSSKHVFEFEHTQTSSYEKDICRHFLNLQATQFLPSKLPGIWQGKDPAKAGLYLTGGSEMS